MYIRPFQSSDHPALGDVTVAAMAEDAPEVRYIFPHRHEYPQDLRSFFVRALKAKHVDPGVFTLVAVTDAGDPGPDSIGVDSAGNTLIGRVTVQRKGSDQTAEERKLHRVAGSHFFCAFEGKLLSMEARYIDAFRLNKAIDKGAYKNYLAAANDPGNENVFAGEQFKEMWVVQNLVVDPKYQRRGAGRLLIQWVMQRAKEDGVVVGLVASDEGVPLYRHLGFDLLKEVSLTDKSIRRTYMIWHPHK